MWLDVEEDEETSCRPTGWQDSSFLTPAELGRTDQFRVISLNARSINNKWQKIRDLISNCSPSIVCIQETWGKRPQVDYSVAGFHRTEFAVRTGNGMNLGGGVATIISDKLKYELLESPFEDKIIETLTIRVPAIKAIIINVYCPFGDKRKFLVKISQFLTQLSHKYSGHNITLVGDFNMDLLDPDGHTNELIDFMSSNGFLQLISLPTRVDGNSRTLIDHIYTNSKISTMSCVISTNISDHCPIALTINNRQKAGAGTAVTKRWITDETYTAIKEELAKEKWEGMQSLSIDKATEKLHSTIHKHLDNLAPIETRYLKPKPVNNWLTKGLKTSIRNSDRMYRKVKIGKLDKTEHLKYKLILDKTINLARNMKYQESITSAGSCSRKLWRIVNEVIDRKQTKEKSPNLLVKDGKEIQGHKEVANVFNQYFAAIGTKMANSIPHEPGFETYIKVCRDARKLDLRTLGEDEVGSIMKGQMPKLSTGIDEINNKIIKTCWEELKKPMTIIVNKSIEQSIVPALHKQAKIVPLFKKGDKKETGNYRPVSLLPALSKILEKAICKQVMLFLNKHQLLCPNQFGFRTRNQTTHVVHSLLNTVAENATKNKCTIATFIDLSKAFDCLQYDKLFKKMEGLNFSEPTIKWFKSYLSERKQCVSLEGELSDWLPVELGILTSGYTAEEAAEKMNKTLEKVHRWFRQNKLNLNPSKTRYMIFNSKTNKDDLVKIDNETLLRVWNRGKEKSFKLVGIHLDEKLNWGEHIAAVGKKISMAMYGLHKAGRDLDCKRRKLLYSGLIHSHLTYGLPIWGHATQGRLNTLLVKQKKAIRQIFRLPYNTHTLPYFVKANILQLPELVEHTTLCYIQSGLDKNSPFHVKALWYIREQSQYLLREKGIMLDFPISSKNYINRLPLVCQAKLWNNQPYEKQIKESSRQSYKSRTKFEMINNYFSSLTEEELIFIGTGEGIMEDE